MKKHFELIVALVAIVTVVITFVVFTRLVKQSQSDQTTVEKSFSQTDTAILADVEKKLKSHLLSLPSDHEITQRYGTLVAVEGTGQQRQGGRLEHRPIVLRRQLVFPAVRVPCEIIVSKRGPVQFDIATITPNLTKEQNNHAPDRPQITVTVTHPDFESNAAVFQDTLSENTDVGKVLDEFVNGVLSQDQQRLAVVRRWYDSRQSDRLLEPFIRLALAHSNEAVRLQAAQFASMPRQGQKVIFSDSFRNELLIALQDESQPVPVRRQLVLALLQESEPYRAELYKLLRDLGDKGYFAVQPISEFIVDRSKRHWSKGGGYDAPIGSVELLQAWGKNAEEAVPALIVVMQEHPNQWDFAPAAARALGAFGVHSSELVAELQLATTAGYGRIRKAAAEALQRLPVTNPSATGEALRFSKPETREQFYPLNKNTTHCWLSGDRESVMFLRVEDGTASLYQANLQSALCEQLVQWESGDIRSVAGRGDDFVVLRLNDVGETRTLYADTWSIASLKRTKITTIYQMRRENPRQILTIDNVVWSDERAWVAFVATVRTPRDRQFTREQFRTQGLGRGKSPDRSVQIKSLDNPNPTPDDRLSEYLMMPVGFSSSGKQLYLDGWCFEIKAYAIGAVNVVSRKTTPILVNQESRPRLSTHRGKHDWIVTGHQSGRTDALIELFDPHANLTRTFNLGDEPAYFPHPWEIAVAFTASGKRMAVVTRSGVDVFDTETAKLVNRRALVLPKSPYKVQPIFFATDGDGFVLAMTQGSGPQRKDPSSQNELRLVRIDSDPRTD